MTEKMKFRLQEIKAKFNILWIGCLVNFYRITHAI